MATKCIWYGLETLKKIQPLAKNKFNYHSFCIDTPTRAWITALGIRSRTAKYRRNRAGKNLFYHITSIVNRHEQDTINSLPSTPSYAVNRNNLLIIKTKDKSSQSICAHYADVHSTLINCRSVVNKTQDVHQASQQQYGFLFCVLTETWIKEEDTITSTRLCPNGYKSLSIPRLDKVGGGIAIVYKSKFNVSKAKGQPYKTVEPTCFNINTGYRIVNLIAIYMPPDSNILELCNEFTNLLQNHINSSDLLLLEDFNIAVHKPLDAEPATFLEMLDSFNLVNKVDKPTHRLSNTLDLIIHDANSNTGPKIKVDRLFSDHSIVFFDITIPSTTTISNVQAYRKYKNINPNAFMKDVWKFLCDKPPGPSLDDKIGYYNTMLPSILDNHAPITSWKCSNCTKVPWFNDDIAEAIRHRRHLERVWYREKTNVHAFTSFHCQCQLMSNLLDKAECEFFFSSTTENLLNSKHIYDVCNHLLGRTKESPLPPGYTNQELVDRFNNYFIDKTVKICTNLAERCQHLPPYVEIPAPPEIQQFSKFQPITLSKLKKIILSRPSKSSEPDPIPTSLLKQNFPPTVQIIADIINISLRDGVFPESLKKALVKPLLKKVNLDLLDRNYRPVSNFGYDSKCTEHAAATQLVDHIESHGLMKKHQSAYSTFHSTEAAFLRAKRDVIRALENQEVTCLVLNLSAAFDTTDHDTLLSRMETRFTVTSVTLNWFRLYLTEPRL